MPIERKGKMTNASRPGRYVFPNEQHYCVECQAIMPAGYLIEDRVTLGQTKVFVCDECLGSAKTFGRWPASTESKSS